MRRKNRRKGEDSNISFLDIICCGFGAIVLLLVIVKPTPPVVLEESIIDLSGQVRQKQERLFEIRGQVAYLETELNAKQEQLGSTQQRVAILRSELDLLNARQQAVDVSGADDQETLEDMQIALQSLTEEMRRLLKTRRANDNFIGGIPVDSEYVILILDTSGSMQQAAWGRLLQEVRNVLNLYPNVKGIQVMNDQGQYMFRQYAGDWMPDTPAQRRIIMTKLQSWNAFSNSSPVQGVFAAIRRHFEPNKKVSLFVFGDDFTGSSSSRVLKMISEMNQQQPNGDTLVRIHTVGFPVQFRGQAPQIGGGAMRYANLMRLLAEQNNGSFIGLNAL